MEYINLQQCINLLDFIKIFLVAVIAIVTIVFMCYMVDAPTKINKKDKED